MFLTMLILPKDSWTNIIHVVYFLLDLIQWFWPHPEKVHAQEKQSKKRAAITKKKKKKRQVLPVVVPEAKTGEFILALSFLLFLFYFVLSALDSSPPPRFSVSYHVLSNIAPSIIPHLSSSLPYIFPSSLCSLLPHYPFTACHSVTSPHALYSRLVSPVHLTSANPSPSILYATSSLCCSFFSRLSFLFCSKRLWRGDAPVPERRNVLPEPEVHLSSGVQGGTVPTFALWGGQGLQRRFFAAPFHGHPAARHSANLPAGHINAPLSHENPPHPPTPPAPLPHT